MHLSNRTMPWSVCFRLSAKHAEERELQLEYDALEASVGAERDRIQAMRDLIASQVRSPKLTVGFSQSSYILMTYRVVGAGYLSVRSRISNEVRTVAETGE